MERAARWLPGLGLLRTYDRAWLAGDLSAGVILGAVMVPVGLAFGELAGAPLAGLYAGILPLVAYALFGSSRQMIVGPDASMAALVAVSVAPLAGGDVGRLATLAGGLAVLIGLLCVLSGFLRLGFLADFLSKPVIVGYMHGLAVVIAVGQLPKVLGVRAEGDTTIEQFLATVRALGDANPHTLAIGVACVAVILGFRRWLPRIPGQVVALIGAVLAVVLFDLERRNVSVVGAIPGGLPRPQLPLVGFDDIRTLLPIALVAALLSFSDTMVTGRGFASRNRYRIDANQELLAVGAANIASGVTQGLPISASGSRTAVAEAAGGRSQVTSLVAAIVVACAMLFLTDMLYFLPAAALGGILLAAAWNLCDVNEFRRIWRFRGEGLVGALLTLAGVVGLGVMEGIAIGVAFSLVLVVRALAMPADAELGRIGTDEFHDLAGHADAQRLPGIIIYRFPAPLFFVNCTYFRRRVESLVDATPDVRTFIVDAAAMSEVDLAACELLSELRTELGGRGIRFVIANMRTRVRSRLSRDRDPAVNDENLYFSSVGAAVRAAPEAT